LDKLFLTFRKIRDIFLRGSGIFRLSRPRNLERVEATLPEKSRKGGAGGKYESLALALLSGYLRQVDGSQLANPVTHTEYLQLGVTPVKHVLWKL